MNKKDFDEKVFHDTKLLLEHYRDVVWSLEVETFQTSINFQKEYGTTLEDFLDMTYKAGMKISESDVASRIESMNKSRNMLKIIDRAMELLQMKHQDGEWYYWILYLTYLAPKKLPTTEDILYELEKQKIFISRASYYRLRDRAISQLGWILWGYTTKSANEIIDKLLAGKTYEIC